MNVKQLMFRCKQYSVFFLSDLKLICAGIGFLYLVGTVVNNPIRIVEKALCNIDSQQMQSFSAIIECVRSRLQHDSRLAATGVFAL